MLAKVAVVLLVVSASEAVRTGVQSTSSTKAYDEFRRQFGVERPNADAKSYMARVALFERRREEVRKHNARPGITWFAAVNKFADYSPSEFEALLGQRHRGGVSSPSSSFLQLRPSAALALSVDWSSNLSSNINKMAKNQGGCGSCWAVAAAGAIEAHLEIAGYPAAEVSYEQLVDCTPNLLECGGQGGCKGATCELAFQYIKEHGIVAMGDYKGYQHGGDGTCKPQSAPMLSLTGYVQLPANKYQPLAEALATKGPVVVSADASGWGAYSKGVFNECEKDAVINHAILAMGYGTDSELKKDFFLIRNSWGADWGEKGFIRIERHTDENAYCGTDHKPLDGVGCKGGPATLKVCGMCGILADSAHPTDVQLYSKQAKA